MPHGQQQRRDWNAEVEYVRERIRVTEQQQDALHRQLHASGVLGEERLVLLRAIAEANAVQAKHADSLATCLAAAHAREQSTVDADAASASVVAANESLYAHLGEQHRSASSAALADDSPSPTRGQQHDASSTTRTAATSHTSYLTPAAVVLDAQRHGIRMYADHVFIPSPSRSHDPQLRRRIEGEFSSFQGEGVLWYQTQWAFRRRAVGVIVEFKVLPQAAASFAEVLATLGAVSDVGSRPTASTWHGKHFVSPELLHRARHLHVPKADTLESSLWETSSDVTTVQAYNSPSLRMP